MKTLPAFIRGFLSLITGLRITLKEFFKPVVTLQYPHESLPMPARFRGHIELVRDPATGRAICFACKCCEKACPSDCITVEGMKFEGEKRKSVTVFKLDFTRCSLCSSCVDACKSNAIRFSKQYNLASTSKEEFVMDLFKKLEAEGKTEAEGITAVVESK
jgi:NADH-quinone oxidoreductase subunit I